jgi:hypothetical protein
VTEKIYNVLFLCTGNARSILAEVLLNRLVSGRFKCPVWPGQRMSAHWGIEDPAAVQGRESKQRRSFALAFSMLQRRSASSGYRPHPAIRTVVRPFIQRRPIQTRKL